VDPGGGGGGALGIERDENSPKACQGLGFGVWSLGFEFWGSGFGVWGLGFGVWGLGFGDWHVVSDGKNQEPLRKMARKLRG